MILGIDAVLTALASFTPGPADEAVGLGVAAGLTSRLGQLSSRLASAAQRARDWLARGNPPAAASFVQSAPSARILGRNLEAAGFARPAGFEAHHIVAGSHRLAGRGREVLTQFGVDINAAANGVFLPGPRAANRGGASLHRSLPNGYYEAVNKMLDSAQSRDEVLRGREYVRSVLLSGGSW